MSSNNNKGNNDGTSFKRSESGPILCANGCGFFGQAATNNLCSKCFRELQNHEEQEAKAKAKAKAAVDKISTHTSSVKAAGEPLVLPAAAVVDGGVADANQGATRCLSCQKKVGMLGFKCRCGSTFCGVHRYPEKHECGYDFKSAGKEAIAQANPVVKADKIRRF